MRIMKIRTMGAGSLVAILALGGCDDLLDVGNPNDLVEKDVIQNKDVANAVVNGAEALVFSSVSQSWQPYLVASDEMSWIGSRDAWLSLDQGRVRDPLNEFIDGPFPAMGQARWMSDKAIEIVGAHDGEDPAGGFKRDLARANFYSGIIYMMIGEIQEDFAFSDKKESAAPVGPDNMYTVLDGAISRLTEAVTGFESVGDHEMALNARAVRARARQSRAIWDVINPPSGNGLVNASDAGADAAAVIAEAGGNEADWTFNMTYSATSVSNSMAGWVNDRKENQIDVSIATRNASNDIDGIAMMDPIDGVEDPAVIKWLNQWKDGNYLNKGGVYAPLTLVSTRMMHLILAENALASGNTAAFRERINHIRALDGLTPFDGQIDDMEMLKHTRRVNVLLQGLRLADMYRWGIEDPLWEPSSTTKTSPGEMLPISVIECRANSHLNDDCTKN